MWATKITYHELKLYMLLLSDLDLVYPRIVFRNFVSKPDYQPTEEAFKDFADTCKILIENYCRYPENENTDQLKEELTTKEFHCLYYLDQHDHDFIIERIKIFYKITQEVTKNPNGQKNQIL